MRTRFSVLLLIGFLAISQTALATDWPQWRGVHRDGISDEVGWLMQWPAEGPRVIWKADVGRGYSSFAIVAAKLYTMGFVATAGSDGKPIKSADGKVPGMEVIWCLDAGTGGVLWKREDPLADEVSNWSGTFGTPTIFEGRVYAVGKFGLLQCLNANTGKLIWSKDLVKQLGGPTPFYGYSCSPLVSGDLVIVECGGKQAQHVALNRLTGEVVWKWSHGDAGFSSPVPCNADGKRAVVVVTPSIIAGLRAETGEELWRYEGKRKGAMNTCATPIVSGDKVFVPGSWNGRRGVVLQITRDGPKVLWESTNFLNFVQSPLLVDGYIFGIHSTDNARSNCSLRCVRFDTGEVMWDHAGFGHATLISAAGKLIILSDRGELSLVDASRKEFHEMARAQVVDRETLCCPVLCSARIYCRNNAGNIVCLDVKP